MLVPKLGQGVLRGWLGLQLSQPRLHMAFFKSSPSYLSCFLLQLFDRGEIQATLISSLMVSLL